MIEIDDCANRVEVNRKDKFPLNIRLPVLLSLIVVLMFLGPIDYHPARQMVLFALGSTAMTAILAIRKEEAYIVFAALAYIFTFISWSAPI